MHSRTRLLQPFVAVLIAIAFVGGSFLHSVIPHDHGQVDACAIQYGYGHCPAGASESETGLWHFIHESLAHEEKKSIALFDQSILITVLALIVVRSLGPVFVERTFADSLDLALSRGRFKYRAFG